MVVITENSFGSCRLRMGSPESRLIRIKKAQLLDWALNNQQNGGDGEIRTRGTQNVRTLSKGLVSTTHPHLRIKLKSYASLKEL